MPKSFISTTAGIGRLFDNPQAVDEVLIPFLRRRVSGSEQTS